MDELISFGQWVKRRRAALHLTQDGLARRVFCSLAMLRKVEADERRPSQELAERLAQQLVVPILHQHSFLRSARGEFCADQLVLPEQMNETLLRPATLINLPTPLTSLIGRADDITAVCKLILHTNTRLLTLIGPPGIGKTRLSIAVASSVTDAFPDGVVFVPLAAINDCSLVLSAIAQSLGVSESANRSFLDGLKIFLYSRQLLLVLDNIEQVVQSALTLTELLANAPKLKILVTSRIALRLQGEQRYTVQSLTLPQLTNNAKLTDPVTAFAHYPAIALFVQRTQSVIPTFQLTHENAGIIAELCTRLDGLPLAIELAAARSTLFTPYELLLRLNQRFTLLANSSVDVPERQKTLRNAIHWSYDLLPDAEQTLLRRLGVFAGGFTLELVEQVCNSTNDLGVSVLDGIATLIDNSLVRQIHQQTTHANPEQRFELLETIREYAVEQLKFQDEYEMMRMQHAQALLALAEQAEPGYELASWPEWRIRLDREPENFRAALTWAKTGGDAVVGLRLACALSWYWVDRGHWREGRTWLEEMLNSIHNTELQPLQLKARIKLVNFICEGLNQYETVEDIFLHCLELAQQLNDRYNYAIVQKQYGSFLRRLGKYSESQPWLEQAIAVFRQMDERWHLANGLLFLGDTFRDLGEYSLAQSHYEESMLWSQRIGNRNGEAWIWIKLGEIARDQRKFVEARPWLEQAITLFTEQDQSSGLTWGHINLGIVELAQGNTMQAKQLFMFGLDTSYIDGHSVGLAYCLKGLAGTLAAENVNNSTAISLFAAADATLTRIGAGITPGDRVECDPYLVTIRANSNSEAFTQAWALGQSLTLEQAVALAVS